ncbi:MAG: hypothetical protein VKK80_12505 [Prochlorothrix sp.]|mgnify:CR=1 FL=1|nr:hypothetical protein [Prochlorothrix sp.]
MTLSNHDTLPLDAAAAPAELTAAPATADPCAHLEVTEKARCLMVQHHREVKKRDQALLTRVAEDVGISAEEVAHFSNHIQGKPTAGSSGYDRSPASMS